MKRAFVAALALLALSGVEGAGFAPQERIAPGLVLNFEGRDIRVARLAALYVPEGASPTSFLAPGPFKASFEGYVSVDIGTECVFSAEGTGRLAVTINDAVALEGSGDLSKGAGKPLRLKKGRNRLVARYESPAKGDAWVRLFWASSDFEREPIPPIELSHDADARPLRAALLLREGRELVTTRRCLNCHGQGMEGPSLLDVGTRLHADWMAAWIADPRALRADATMPRLHAVSKQDAADIAAFLGRPGATEPPGATADGGKLFAELRCVGCHTRPDKEPAADRISLRHLRAKWKPAALREFLRAPEKHYALIRMPNFNLTKDEAAKLAAFLLARCPDLKLDAPKGDAALGRAKIGTAGCANCHKVDIKNEHRSPARIESADCKAADFGLTAGEREAIAAFLATDRVSFDAPVEFAERQIEALRCAACHKRDGRQDLWSDFEDEAAEFIPKPKEDPDVAPVDPIEPVVPSLTWTGEKLKPEWTAAFLAGKVAYRPRPWLPARMPSFPARAEVIARGLALGHGRPVSSAPEPAPEPKLAEIGRQLAGQQAPSLACVKCHAVGRAPAVGVFEAPGPDFARVRERITKDYYHRWMSLPLRLEPGTKMPQFADKGRSQLVEVLEGDATRQYEALWQWLLEGDKIRPPE